MLSRVANSIYWLSRYIERADNVARFVSVNLDLMLDADVGQEQQWQPLINTSGDHNDFEKRYGEATQENVIQFLAFDKENPNSILSCLRAARENARQVREIIVSSMWQQVNEFYLFVRDNAAQPDRIESLNRFFIQVRRGTSTHMGLTDSTMTRGEPYHFSRLGRMLERADKTSRIVDMKYFILLKSISDIGTPIDHVQWSAVLRSASAFEMYRKQHGAISPFKVVDFLLFSHEFPRAVRFCLDRAAESLHAITKTPEGQVRSDLERVMGSLRSDFTYNRSNQVIESGLHEYLDDLQDRLNQVGTQVHQTFFARKVPASGESSRHRASSESDSVFTAKPIAPKTLPTGSQTQTS